MDHLISACSALNVTASENTLSITKRKSLSRPRVFQRLQDEAPMVTLKSPWLKNALLLICEKKLGVNRKQSLHSATIFLLDLPQKKMQHALRGLSALRYLLRCLAHRLDDGHDIPASLAEPMLGSRMH